MSENTKNELGKVPAVTMTFWVVKILATTLGETGGNDEITNLSSFFHATFTLPSKYG
jgi:uncharacterized membrane-anchored protein